MRCTRVYENESGTTMAEVLVGFAFLLIMMASFVRIIDISSELLMTAKDTVSEQEQLQEQLYRRAPDADVVDVNMPDNITLTFYEMEEADSCEASLRTGVSLRLENAEVKAVTDSALGVTVYQVLYHENEQTE